MVYLIPKNIKTKREIFKGFSMLEILYIAIACIIGFIFQNFVNYYKLKIFLFFIFPLSTFLLLMPLPNGLTPLIIFKRCVIYNIKQKKYKFKN